MIMILFLGFDMTYIFQLQRIVSRCACEFYYASHEEAEQCSSGDAWGTQHQPYDSFMLMHHDLDVCTNSLQVHLVTKPGLCIKFSLFRFVILSKK